MDSIAKIGEIGMEGKYPAKNIFTLLPGTWISFFAFYKQQHLTMAPGYLLFIFSMDKLSFSFDLMRNHFNARKLFARHPMRPKANRG